MQQITLNISFRSDLRRAAVARVRSVWRVCEGLFDVIAPLIQDDELVLEVAPGEREPLEALVRAEMGAAAELTVPLDVSVGTGRSWHEAAH